MNKKSQKSKHPNGILNVLVLIAGTTDPVNASTEKSKYANSYTQETSQDLALQNHESYTQVPVNYWDKEFKEQIEAFDEEYVNLVLFPFHGWTGDNSKENREIAGAYLVNRLCGANGEKAYYEKTWQNKPIYFHLLGHSHGGNVVNEMTKQIDKLGSKWPKEWKIKSLIYLSTPFFKKLHQVKVNENFFHKDAEVLSLYNDFDLTQRMLADFSMEPLVKTLIISNEVKNINKQLIKIQKFEFPKLPFLHLEDVDDRLLSIDLEWTMSNKDGEKVYNSFLGLFNDVKSLIKIILDIVKILSTEKTSFNISKSLLKKMGKNKLSYERMIIPNKTAKKIFKMLELLQEEIDKNIKSFDNRIKEHTKNQSNYLVKNFWSDFYINKLVELLIQFLDIDANILISNKDNSLWNALYEILEYNIDIYDNTYTKPNIQFENSFLKDKITNINVTKDDIYSSKKEAQNYYKFIKYIEEIENRCENNLNQTNLLDLLFTLTQQFGIIYEYKGIGFGTALIVFANYVKIKRISNFGFNASEFEKRIFELANLITNLQEIFKKRDFGGIIDTSHKLSSKQIEENKDNNPYNDTLKRGSIPYLLIESHSTSRRWLHKEVKEFLKRLGAKR